MVMKPGKFPCCMFLLAIWRVDPTQNLEKYKTWLCVLMQLTNNNNHNNKLYLHGHKRELQHCRSILRIIKKIIKVNPITIIKLSIIDCLEFLNRMIRIVLVDC